MPIPIRGFSSASEVVHIKHAKRCPGDDDQGDSAVDGQIECEMEEEQEVIKINIIQKLFLKNSIERFSNSNND